MASVVTTCFTAAPADVLRGEEGADTLVSIDNSLNDTLWGDGGRRQLLDRQGRSGRIRHGARRQHLRADPQPSRRLTFANGADKTLDGDLIADPGAGVRKDGTAVGFLRYRNFSSQPLFASTGPSPLDVDQGDMGDCWLMSALGSAAKANPNSIRQTVVALGDGTYAVELGNNSIGGRRPAHLEPSRHQTAVCWPRPAREHLGADHREGLRLLQTR